MKNGFVTFVLLFIAGCATPQPPADLSAPGWKVQQGQAIWKPEDGKTEITGDVVLSTHPTGGAYVQFSKAMPILSGRISSSGWEFEATPEGKRYSGGGKPPNRIIWLQMLRALEGREISERWTVAHTSDDFISLEDHHTGERLQVHLQK